MFNFVSEDSITSQCVYEKELKSYLQYILITTRDKSNSTDYYEVFSILVLKTDEDSYTESEFIYDVSRSLKKALFLLDTLYRNHVTPCLAREILEDLL